MLVKAPRHLPARASVYRQEWTGLTEPRVVRSALECLEELGWIRPEAHGALPPQPSAPRRRASRIAPRPVPRRPEAPELASATTRPDRLGGLSVLSVTRAAHPVAHSGAAKRSRTG